MANGSNIFQMLLVSLSGAIHCKKIRISADTLWRVFHILTEPVPYTFVSVNRRNNGAWVHIAMWVRALLFRRFTDTNVYHTEPVSLYMENSLHNILGYTGILYSATYSVSQSFAKFSDRLRPEIGY